MRCGDSTPAPDDARWGVEARAAESGSGRRHRRRDRAGLGEQSEVVHALFEVPAHALLEDEPVDGTAAQLERHVVVERRGRRPCRRRLARGDTRSCRVSPRRTASASRCCRSGCVAPRRVRSTMRSFVPIMCWKNSALVPGLPSPNTLGEASMPTQKLGQLRGSLTSASNASTFTFTWKSYSRCAMAPPPCGSSPASCGFRASSWRIPGAVRRSPLTSDGGGSILNACPTAHCPRT